MVVSNTSEDNDVASSTRTAAGDVNAMLDVQKSNLNAVSYIACRRQMAAATRAADSHSLLLLLLQAKLPALASRLPA